MTQTMEAPSLMPCLLCTWCSGACLGSDPDDCCDGDVILLNKPLHPSSSQSWSHQETTAGDPSREYQLLHQYQSEAEIGDDDGWISDGDTGGGGIEGPSCAGG